MKNQLRGMADWVLIVLFLSALSWPGLLLVVRGSEFIPARENRHAAELPAVPEDLEKLAAFPAEFEDYFKDNYGLRNSLIETHNRLQLALFGHSRNKRVIVGRDGWFYYGDRRTTPYARAEVPLTEEQLETYRVELEGHRDWMANRGIAFLVVIAPIKHSIYPEYLPEYMGRRGRTTRKTQVLEYFAANSDLPILDLTEPVRAQRDEARLYHKTDSHWNMRGSWIGYVEIMAALREFFPGVEPYPFEDVTWETKTTEGMDLAKLLRMSDYLEEVQLIPRMPNVGGFEFVRTDLCADCGVGANAFLVSESKSGEGLRAVVFGDSFFINLRPYLAPHFSRMTGLPSHRINRKVIEHEKPDVVILEIVERQFMYPRRLLVKRPATGQ